MNTRRSKMRFSELKKIREAGSTGAPDHGQMLIYTRQGVLFQSYASIDEVEHVLFEQCGGKDILEVHLFDNKKEYRALSSTGNKAKKAGGVIEYTADFPYETGNVFLEEQLLEMDSNPGLAGGTICVLNHISFDENGMASVDDYRMVMGGVK